MSRCPPRLSRSSRVAILLTCLPTLAAAQATFEVVADISPLLAGGPMVMGGLVRGGDGALYGMNHNVGTTGSCGLVYRLAPDHTLSVLHDFTSVEGCFPLGDLVVGPDGQLWGTAAIGGDEGFGTVFKVALDGTLTRVHSFSSSDGAGGTPRSGLLLGPDGFFYGTTGAGGVGQGAIYRVSPSGSFQQLATGFDSRAALIAGADGRLYGTGRNTQGLSRVFAVTTAPAVGVEVLHTFPAVEDFPNPTTFPEGSSLRRRIGPGARRTLVWHRAGRRTAGLGRRYDLPHHHEWRGLGPQGVRTRRRHLSARPDAVGGDDARQRWPVVRRHICRRRRRRVFYRINPATGVYTVLHTIQGCCSTQEARPLEWSPGVFYYPGCRVRSTA